MYSGASHSQQPLLNHQTPSLIHLRYHHPPHLLYSPTMMSSSNQTPSLFLSFPPPPPPPFSPAPRISANNIQPPISGPIGNNNSGSVVSEETLISSACFPNNQTSSLPSPWASGNQLWDEAGDRNGLVTTGKRSGSKGLGPGGGEESCPGVAAGRMKKGGGRSRRRRKVREPRFSFKTLSEVDVLDDGYKWRKYGQKVVGNTQRPRSYYRCTHDNCRVKKRVERLAEDPRMVITTYEGRHAHYPFQYQEELPGPSNSDGFFW